MFINKYWCLYMYLYMYMYGYGYLLVLIRASLRLVCRGSCLFWFIYWIKRYNAAECDDIRKSMHLSRLVLQISSIEESEVKRYSIKRNFLDFEFRSWSQSFQYIKSDPVSQYNIWSLFQSLSPIYKVCSSQSVHHIKSVSSHSVSQSNI